MASDPQILAPRHAAGDLPDPRRWLTLAVLLLAAFMNLLDVSIVNIAIPSIQRDLHASYADVQWALAGYTLAYALVLITGGRLGDTFGRKRLFLIGVTGFTLMSALCGAAQSPGMLIACRVAQGAMGAIMIPQVLAMIQVIFPPAERIKALAGFGVTAGLGTVSGPLLGGLLIQHNLFGLDWRPIFLINVPVGIIAVVASAVLVRESRAPRPPRLDPVGVGADHGRAAAAALPAGAGPPAGLAGVDFRLHGRLGSDVRRVHLVRAGQGPAGRLAAGTAEPVPRARVRVGIAIAVTFFLGIASFALMLTLFLQLGLGFTPLHAGLTFLPFSARRAGRVGRGGSPGATVRPRRDDDRRADHGRGHGRPDRRLCTITAVAVTTWDLCPALVAAGLGLGAVLAPLADIVLDGSRRRTRARRPAFSTPACSSATRSASL